LERGRIGITPSHLSGLTAVTVSICFLIIHRDDLSIAAASIYFVLACTTDTFKSKIPNLLNLSLLVAGITINTMVFGMQGLLLALAGLALGFGLLLLPYLMGGIGAGDVKALSALGALIGPYALLHVFVYMAFWGGGFAVLHYLYKADLKKVFHDGWHSVCASILSRQVPGISPSSTEPRRGALRFPYSAAIALGYYSFIYWGVIL
jgi:prepilin peptidase CpaA